MTTNRIAIVLAAALGILLAVALAIPPGAAVAQTSAGDASAWAVSPQPAMVLGGLEGGLDGEFVGVVDVVRGVDGSFAVADRRLSSISLFSPDGELLATVGREGEGPGEFSGIGDLVVDADGRLFVLDEWQQRISEFGFDGTFAGDVRLTRGSDERRIGGFGVFRDGSWYAREASQILASGVGELAEDSVGYFRLAGDRIGDLVARVRGAVSTEFKSLGMHGIRYAMFSPRPLGVIRGGCLIVGTSDSPVLRIVDQAGDDRGQVRLDVEVDRTTRGHRSQWADATAEEAGFLQSLMTRAMARKIRMADLVPFANDLVMDELGYLWAQRYDLPEGDGSAEWLVFSETGSAIGTVVLPAPLRVSEISEDEIVGVHMDDLGRQDVRVYALDRGRDTARRPLPPGCDATADVAPSPL